MSAAEAEALTSPEPPILLLGRRRPTRLAAAVAPRSPRLGVMLPYTPLHRLLLRTVGGPVVCTSGNVSDEPICTDDEEARKKLGAIVDAILRHDRPIVRPLDDSVARVGQGGLTLVRRARGFAPRAVPIRASRSVLATGAHLKNTIAVSKAARVVVSQHLGDLGASEAFALHERTVEDLVRFFAVRPDVVACDLHPDYASTRSAERFAALWGAPLVRVQHHHAHVAAVIAEHGLEGRVLGLAWDGAGVGTDGTSWGGEALVVDDASFRRVAHLRRFSLPGGERASREPRRAALGLLWEMFGRAASVDGWDERALETLRSMLATGFGCVRASSIGRLFDAVAAIAGVRQRASYEGQAAMELEWAAAGASESEAYRFTLSDARPAVLDWEPAIHELLRDRARGLDPSRMAARFHEGLAVAALELAQRVGLPRVVLAGGCFQNLRLEQLVRERLSNRGYTVFTARRFPPNDGGLSLGQLFVASRAEEVADVPRDPG